MTTSREIGVRIREVRRLRGWTQSELGDALGVSYAAVSYYESGKRELSLTMIVRVCQTLRLSPNQLLGWYNR